MDGSKIVLAIVIALLAACTQSSTDPLDTPIGKGGSGKSVFHDSMPPLDPIGVSFGSSFGMCAGYCIREYTLQSWGIVGLRRAGPAENSVKPDQTIWARLSSERLNAVLSSIDTMTFEKPYEVIGCPDCADG